LKGRIENILQDFEQQLAQVQDRNGLESLRTAFIGKKGTLTEVFKELKDVSAEQKKAAGQYINEAKDKITQILAIKFELFDTQAINQRLRSENLDIHFPGHGVTSGHFHPLMTAMKDIEDIFIEMGFSQTEGPQIEDDFHNFAALNFPADHPARDMQDTFYLKNGLLLRTQTSTVQVRTMEKQPPPIKIISAGKVYRCDSDVTHSPVFHQVEGLLIDQGVNFAQLKGTLEVFLKKFFGQERTLRFRPSFFPFTEPSAEVDVQCIFCQGKGCSFCKQSGWLEVLGCGMVDPNVLDIMKIDKNIYAGFAFGMGVERLAMLKYGINNIRLLYTNYLHFLKQF